MKLYKGKVPNIARDIATRLKRESDCEILDEQLAEVEADIVAVINEYMRRDSEITEIAKDTIERRGLDYLQFRRVKKQVSEQKGFGFGDDMLQYLTDQILECLMHSPNVEEVFSDDGTMRKKMVEIFKKHLDVDAELDKEVRKRIKNLEEGTEAFDIEYARILQQVKRTKGLE
ncbi:MAG: DUF507 family protein [Deltaproteobacteria bacterium]|nr:DUF507 family protein [Deltaproteobacteria bacterium]